MPPLRGREGEFALIRGLLAAAGRGEGSFVVVEGCAGFGKTRLLQVAVEQAMTAGLRTGVGSAEDGSQAVPLMTLMAALFEGCEPLLDRAKLRDLPSAPEQQFWLLQELAGMLEAAALDSPLLICLDDLQWADSWTLAALRSLTAQLADLPIVWFVALRPEGASSEALAAVERLRQLGFAVADSDANFVLFGQFADQKATWQKLLDRGVLVRDVGLEGWLRVTAGTAAETDAFLAAMETVRDA